ncbi:MAG: ssDNA-binding domain-containing protein [Lachnospiraceae bacterium]|nr:ssDNA-binding domain-containing protein [Lachnospiraceae bacterium]
MTKNAWHKKGRVDVELNDRRIEMNDITDRLEAGIKNFFESARFKEYLNVMSKFHNYSLNNTMLIAMQKPDATFVAGYASWKSNFGRNVKKGEKGIRIIAPSPYKIKKEMEKIDPQTQKPAIGKDGKIVTEEREIVIPAFKMVSVFDVSQTEGKEMPVITPHILTGDVGNYKQFFSVLEKVSPAPISFEKIPGSAHGYYDLTDKRIAIDEGMSELQTLKTTIHEIAHAKLHAACEPGIGKRTMEVEAESIAYIVCQHFNLDTSDYSFSYIGLWSSDKGLPELKNSLETIQNTSSGIIQSIEENFIGLQKAKGVHKPIGKGQREDGVKGSVLEKLSSNKAFIEHKEKKAKRNLAIEAIEGRHR